MRSSHAGVLSVHTCNTKDWADEPDTDSRCWPSTCRHTGMDKRGESNRILGVNGCIATKQIDIDGVGHISTRLIYTSHVLLGAALTQKASFSKSSK